MYQDNNNVHRIKKISIFNPLTAIFLAVGLVAQFPLGFCIFAPIIDSPKIPQAVRKKYTLNFRHIYCVVGD